VRGSAQYRKRPVACVCCRNYSEWSKGVFVRIPDPPRRIPGINGLFIFSIPNDGATYQIPLGLSGPNEVWARCIAYFRSALQQCCCWETGTKEQAMLMPFHNSEYVFKQFSWLSLSDNSYANVGTSIHLFVVAVLSKR